MPRIEIGNKVTIGARSGYLAVNPYTSGVGEILNDHTFLIYVPIINGVAVMFPVNSSFLFVFYTEGGLYQADGKVLEHCVQNKVTLMKIEVGTFEHTQRRDFYRVNVNMPLTYTRMSEAQIAETEKKPIYKGVAKNISGGGLCFTTNTQLSPGEHILCNLTLDGMPTSAWLGESLDWSLESDGDALVIPLGLEQARGET
jgi:c-di-GMP-binding flagellar brake protein YcgR